MEIRPIPVDQLPQTNRALQTPFWAQVKQINGWEPKAAELTGGGSSQQLLILRRRIAPALTLSYVPMGPEYSDPAQLEECAGLLAETVCSGSFAVRLDLPWEQPELAGLSSRLKRLPYTIQPEETIVIPLDGDLEAIARGLRTRARRHLRYTEDTVTVMPWSGDEDEFSQWYQLYLSTAARDGFSPRTDAYLHRMLTLAPADAPVTARLLLAREDGRMTGGIIVLFAPREAVYLFGASIRDSGFSSASYRLQWQAITLAKEHGCRRYDLYGVAPEGAEDHALSRLSLFKSGFGGKRLTREGCVDYAVNPLLYGLFRGAEQRRITSARRAP